MPEPNTEHTRIASLEGFRTLVWELGGNPHEILQATGVDETLWDTPDAPVPIDGFRSALNLAAELTNTSRFGLLLSQRQSFDKLGAVGYAMKHAPSLGVAIDMAVRYVRTHDSAAMSELQIDGGSAVWSFTAGAPTRVSVVQQVDLVFGLAVNFIRATVSPDWRPESVLFEHARPPEYEMYARIFRAPVLFDQPVNALEFRATELDRPLRTSERKRRLQAT